MTGDALTRVLLGMPRNTLRLVRVTVQTVSPLTVKLPDGATVNALAVSGLTYTVSGRGVALVAEGAIPLVLPTA